LRSRRYLSSGRAEDFGGLPVHWHSSLNEVPAAGDENPTEYIIAQELLDALPVFAFQCGEGGVWRERMVAANPAFDPASCDPADPESPRPLQIVLAPAPTPALTTLLRNLNAEGREQSEPHTAAGAVLEVCPEACKLGQDIAARVDEHVRWSQRERASDAKRSEASPAATG
jgi:SAM-dependent MidA family methyltransferase